MDWPASREWTGLATLLRTVEEMLEGLRVVEISAFVAAPLGGATLARMGAQVTRVDPLGGNIDAHRWPLQGGRSLYWAGLNRGKRSVTLDLRSERGQEVAARLAANAGCVLTNLSPRGALSYEQLRARRPDLVMVQITGHRDGRAAVDYTVNAETGFPWITGPAGSAEPVNHVLPAWDVATGYLAVASLLAADRERALTGAGRLVTLSLADVALQVAEHLGLLDEARLLPEERGRFGNEVYGTYGSDFRTADGVFVMVLALTRRQWRSLLSATGLSFDGIPADLTEEGERWAHRESINAAIGEWISARPFAEVSARFTEHEVLWGRFRTFRELVASDPRVTDLLAARAPDPELGGDTLGVLAELGEDVEELRAAGVLGDGVSSPH
jgi:2-methylfumaryl-CoA isomerase